MDNNIYQILQDWHELFKADVITEAEFTEKKKELLGGPKKISGKLNLLLPSVNEAEIQAEPFIISSEEQDKQYEELFGKKKWFERKKVWVIIFISLVIIAITFLFFKNNYQNKINDNDLSNNINVSSSSKILDSSQSDKPALLPFIGKKWYEIYPLFSGTGTDKHYINILSNGDVFFGTVQVNQASQEEHQEDRFIGKFKKIMKFKNKYYQIQSNQIFLVSKRGKIITDSNCCSKIEEYDKNQKCSCESILYK